MQGARTMLQMARQDLVTAEKDATQIRQILRGLRLTTTEHGVTATPAGATAK